MPLIFVVSSQPTFVVLSVFSIERASIMDSNCVAAELLDYTRNNTMNRIIDTICISGLVVKSVEVAVFFILIHIIEFL